MEKTRRSLWPSVQKWFRIQHILDDLFAVLEGTRAGLTQLFRKRFLLSGGAGFRRPSYRPCFEGLEARVMPTMVQFTVSSYAVQVSGNSVSFPVRLDQTSSSTVSVNYTTANNSALAGVDYTAASGTLTILPGNTQGNISVQLLNRSEPTDKSFSLILTSASQAYLGDPSSATITLINGGSLPRVQFPSYVPTTPYNSTATFSLLLSAPSSQTVTVNCSTSSGTALAGTDYTQTSSTVTFTAGSTSATVTVPILNPTETASKYFSLNLTNPVNAELAGSASQTITILMLDSVVARNASTTYDGAAHGTTAEVYAQNGTDLGPATLSYSSGSVPVNAGTYTAWATSNYANYVSATATASVTITQALLTLTAVTNTKTYSATTRAAAIPTFAGLKGSDTVTGLSEAYASKNVGTNLVLSVSSGYVIHDNNNGHNYAVTTVTNSTGAINKGALTLTAVTNAKTYDATTNAGGTPTVAGLLGSDTVTGLTESYASKNVGTGLTLSVNSGYTVNDGNSGGNYTVTTATNATGVINKAALTFSAATNTKTYDATVSAPTAPTVSGLLGSDTATGLAEVYGTPKVGTNLTLSVSAYTINDGNSGGNYTVSTLTNTTGVINKAALTIAAVTATKVYDATTSSASIPTFSGLKGSDTVTATTEAYSNPGVGTGKTLTVASFTVNDGNSGGNYTASTSTNLAGAITLATPAISVSDPSGTYKGAPFTATYVLSGVGGPSPTLENVSPTITYYDSNNNLLSGAPTTEGSYKVTATFPGSADYATVSASTNFTIAGQGQPIVTVYANGGTFNGLPFAATATLTGLVAGVDNTPAPSLEGVFPTLAYYDSNNNLLSGAPTHAGTYKATAAFGPSADYPFASATATFTIAKGQPDVKVMPYSVACDGTSHATTAEVYGVSGTDLGAGCRDVRHSQRSGQRRHLHGNRDFSRQWRLPCREQHSHIGDQRGEHGGCSADERDVHRPTASNHCQCVWIGRSLRWPSNHFLSG